MTNDTERLDAIERLVMRVGPDLSCWTNELTFFFEQNYYRICDEHDPLGKGVTLRDAIDSMFEGDKP